VSDDDELVCRLLDAAELDSELAVAFELARLAELESPVELAALDAGGVPPPEPPPQALKNNAHITPVSTFKNLPLLIAI